MSEQARQAELFGQLTGRAAEAVTLFADAQQRLLKEFVALSADAALESVRLYADLQQTVLDALRDTQTATLRYQNTWQDLPKDPVRWSQTALSETVDGAQKALRIVESNVQALGRTAERLQTSAERTGKGVQDALTGVVTKMKEIYARA
jgi:hypothetical protein